MKLGTIATLKTGAAALALSIGLTLAGGVAVAQQAPSTPPPGASPPPVTEQFPVAIHPGVCPQPEPQPVGDPVTAEVIGAAAEEGQPVGTTQLPLTLSASLTLETTIEDITTVPHVVAVHQSPEEFGTLVACGDIAGTLSEDLLVVGLRPVGEGTIAGIATFQEEDEQVQVSALLVPEVMAAMQ